MEKRKLAVHLRHHTGHADEGIDCTETNTNPPKSRPSHYSLAKSLITSREAQHGAVAVR